MNKFTTGLLAISLPCLLPIVTNAATLPGTALLDWPEEDLSGRLMDGAHRFVERKIAEAPAQRAKFWAPDFSSDPAYTTSLKTNRARLRAILGVVDQRKPAAMERYGDEFNPALVAETERYRIFQVRWPVLDGLWGCGLLAQPKGAVAGGVVLVPDAGQWPEQLFGLTPGLPFAAQTARRFAEHSFEVIVPVTISRDKFAGADPASDQTYREWIYRQAFHLGRHVIGYEIQTVLAAVDWLQGRGRRVGVVGYAEGGLTALHAAAVDPRINATLVSGYFDARERVWAEPIYRNMWGRLREFGDAEIAALILPRTLVVEHSPGPVVTGHKGDWGTPEFASVQAELNRIATAPRWPKPRLLRSDAGPYADPALTAFVRSLGTNQSLTLSPAAAKPPIDQRRAFDAAARHERYFREMEGHVQQLIQNSEHVRDRTLLFSIMPELEPRAWTTAPREPTREPEKFIEGARLFRTQFRTEAIGQFEDDLLPFNARSRLVRETERWTAYDVVLDVYPEFFAWGLLVLPKDLRPGERRPVVVCQHGRDGLPRDLLDGNTTGYRNVAAVLAERGFITFAPHNLYRGEDRYRWLSRKANSIQASLFSFILASHDQILRWLEAQPFVDAARIGFYGLSYGGETAVRIPPLLEKYALSICSGDFNQWTRKVASTEEPFSFMHTTEWEMPYWNLGHTFDYAEMAYLMVPRPFMVERGHRDLVGRDQWVAHEYAKVRWLYAQLGLADRTEIEFFQGGHSMRGEGTFDFLHRHLRWPAPPAPASTERK